LKSHGDLRIANAFEHRLFTARYTVTVKRIKTEAFKHPIPIERSEGTQAGDSKA
jgi:hypothetical protein